MIYKDVLGEVIFAGRDTPLVFCHFSRPLPISLGVATALDMHRGLDTAAIECTQSAAASACRLVPTSRSCHFSSTTTMYYYYFSITLEKNKEKVDFFAQFIHIGKLAEIH